MYNVNIWAQNKLKKSIPSSCEVISPPSIPGLFSGTKR